MVADQLHNMIRTGVIEPSTSSWASPITLVPKKDGSTQFCVDYQKLNAVTKKDSYPLPLIQDIFDQLSGAAVGHLCRVWSSIVMSGCICAFYSVQ